MSRLANYVNNQQRLLASGSVCTLVTPWYQSQCQYHWPLASYALIHQPGNYATNQQRLSANVCHSLVHGATLTNNNTTTIPQVPLSHGIVWIG